MPASCMHASQLHGWPTWGLQTDHSFVLMCSAVMEWLVGEHRAHAIILQHCFLGLGIILLSGVATKIFHWRLVFLLAGAPLFPIISNIW